MVMAPHPQANMGYRCLRIEAPEACKQDVLVTDFTQLHQKVHKLLPTYRHNISKHRPLESWLLSYD